MTPPRGGAPARPRSLCRRVVIRGTRTAGDAAPGKVQAFSCDAGESGPAWPRSVLPDGLRQTGGPNGYPCGRSLTRRPLIRWGHGGEGRDPVVTIAPRLYRVQWTWGTHAREAIAWESALNLVPLRAHRRAVRSGTWTRSAHHAVGFAAAPRGAERTVREWSFLLIRSHPVAIRPGPRAATGQRVRARCQPFSHAAHRWHGHGLTLRSTRLASSIPSEAKNDTGSRKSARHTPQTTSNKGQKNPAIRGCPAAPPDVLSTHAEDGGPLSPSTAPTVGIVRMSVRSRLP
jgi:hypothetical protein